MAKLIRVSDSLRFSASGILLVFAGILSGYIWLSPVFALPGESTFADSGITLERALRVLSPLSVLPIVLLRLPTTVARSAALHRMAVPLCVAPLLGVIVFPNQYYVLSLAVPLMVSGLGVAALSALKRDEFQTWVIGVGIAACAFLAFSLLNSGLTTTSYYGRPRSALGFMHPIQGASAILAATIAAGAFAQRLFRSRAAIRNLMLLGMGVTATQLMIMVSSRNTLAAFLIGICGWLIAKRGTSTVRLALAFGLLIPLFLFYAWSTQPHVAPTLWNRANEISSLRLTVYAQLLSVLEDEPLFTLLLGPTQYVQGLFEAGYRGFATGESVYFSIFFSTGLLGLVGFLFAWTYLSLRLIKLKASLAFGAWCAASLFFAFDAQGITPSNLAVFILVAYAIGEPGRISSEHRVLQNSRSVNAPANARNRCAEMAKQ